MKLPVINIKRDALLKFNDAILKEWLITNKSGGYAASTILGINTRKYHGLLVAALQPPSNRTVCLAKLDEEVFIGENLYLLGANEFHDRISPMGHLLLSNFSLNPLPKYIYQVWNVEVKKTIFMPKNRNIVTVVYEIFNKTTSKIRIHVFPLLTCRHFHSILDRNRSPLDYSQKQKNKGFQVTFSIPKATITSWASKGKFIEKTAWLERLYYRCEANRGESDMDDCFRPGYFEVESQPESKEEFAIITEVSSDSENSRDLQNRINNALYDVEDNLGRELHERKDLLINFYNSRVQVTTNDWLSWIILAADSFICRGSGGRLAVMAGYFWFGTWGRDTFISLPGLMLATGRFDDARIILLDFVRYSRRGLIPNYFNDRFGEVAYNTVDATLWFFNAILQFLKYTGDFKFVRKHLWETMKEIVEHHEKGTVFGIHLDNDGLLAHGPRLTWMDAEVDGKAVTPRTGKAVEIQALWYNALKTMQLLANKFDEVDLSAKYAKLSFQAQRSFKKTFWNSKKNCLFDVVKTSTVDESIRPNQIIAVALDFTMLESAKNQKIVSLVIHELVTPYGLRTLARSDSKYQGLYIGDRKRRDQAYHNGTVWPWLFGPFIKSFLKTGGCFDSKSNYAFKNYVLPLLAKQIYEAGLGTISEIFDGDEPHSPRGCIAQAWSVAEPLRAYLEDVLGIRPNFEELVLKS